MISVSYISTLIFILLFGFLNSKETWDKNTEILKRQICELFPKSLEKECHINQKEKYGIFNKCFLCNHIVSFLDHKIDRSLKPEQIQKLLTNTCKLFSSPLKENCIEFSDKNGLKVIKKLVKEENSKHICKKKYCSEEKELNLNIEKNITPVECFLCREIIAILNKLIYTNATEKQIISALEKVCWLLPSNRKDSCVKFIDKYGGKIIEFLMAGNSAKMICKFLLLCSQNKDKYSKETLYFIPETNYQKLK